MAGTNISSRSSLNFRPREKVPAFYRAYRNSLPQAGERQFQILVEQTDLWITARANTDVDLPALALKTVTELRGQIQAWRLLNPEFGSSLHPLPLPPHAPEIVRLMGEAARVANVGPMAAVAGGIAALVARTLLPHSPDCIVENGGDIMLHSTRDRVVGLLTDPKERTVIGLRLRAGDFPLSLCASSSTFGHSLSFGQADLAVARSKDAFLADALATALCNSVKSPDDVEKVIAQAAALEHEGLDGVFLKCGGRIGIWGKMELAEE